LTEERQAAGRRIDDLNEERRCDAEERRRLLALVTDLADARAAAQINAATAAAYGTN